MDGVFIKNFNCDSHFKIADQVRFVREIVREMRARMGGREMKEMGGEEIGDIEELVKAIRNLIRYSNLLMVSKFNSGEVLSVLCALLQSTENANLKQTCKSLRTLIFAMLLKIQESERHRV